MSRPRTNVKSQAQRAFWPGNPGRMPLRSTYQRPEKPVKKARAYDRVTVRSEAKGFLGRVRRIFSRKGPR